MSYKKVYKQDNDYQKIIKKYETARVALQTKANYGSYKFETLLENATTIQSDLVNSIMEFNRIRVAETKEMMDHLDNRVKKVGIAKRESDVKEFEMLYKLADDNELKSIVNDLNTNDLLEVNLLRLELKERKLDDLDQTVRGYAIRNRLNGLDEIEQKEYDYRQNRLNAYVNVGIRYLVTDEALIPLDNIHKELWNIAKSTDSVK